MSAERLNQFLQKFQAISDEERKEIAAKLIVRTFKKGSLIQEEGKIPKNCFFVLGGCVRQYQVVDGVERTTEFYTDQHAAISSECYMNQAPSTFYLECLEDAILMVGEPEHDKKMIDEHPILQSIMMKVAEEEWLKSQNTLSTFKILSPEKRYTDFLQKRRDLINRVSSNQIASYLGITPESLSRIRKRILTKEQNISSK